MADLWSHLGIEAQHGHEDIHENETDDIIFYDVIGDVTSNDIMEQEAGVMTLWSRN